MKIISKNLANEEVWREFHYSTPYSTPTRNSTYHVNNIKQFDEDCQGCRRHLLALDSLDVVFMINTKIKIARKDKISFLA